MKVLLVNKFLYPKGGDAKCTLATGQLLSEKGHRVDYWGMKDPANPVLPYTDTFVENIDYNGSSSVGRKIADALKILYSLEARAKISRIIEAVKPDIVHLHNFAHQISPSVLHILKKRSIPTVMTMHDYKLVCPAYTMYSKGAPCEKCGKGRYYHCLINKCVKGSYLKSLISMVEMYLHFKVLRIYKNVHVFISPSAFLKNKLRDMGFNYDIIHLPNFVHIEDYLPQYQFTEKSFCYAGRLSAEKGLLTLIRAVKGLDMELKIVGEGPLSAELRQYARAENISNIRFLGYRTGDELTKEISSSLAVVVPSEWYENNPLSIIEAFAMGKPVLGARIGGIPELVKDGETGYTFESRNTEDLRNKILRMTSRPDQIIEMGKAARKFVEVNNNPDKHYNRLLEIYQMASDRARRK
ncbi:MAG: glycosyltransferase family 4 protein [Candidatus Erginobacter occultus]|nr:glycosyltransferase family 4 protein [Candidatus Erginobacter occultus]